MTLDEMAKQVGMVKLVSLTVKATNMANNYNKNPWVDQGGQPVHTTPERELYFLLEKEIKEKAVATD